MEERPIRTIEYRGYSVPIFADTDGQQFWCVLDGEEVGFGAFNTNYEEDLEYLIDKKLDFICNFKQYPGAELTWFFNGYSGYRDIKLTYRTRIIKVFLVEDGSKITQDKIHEITKISEDILAKIITNSKIQDEIR